MNFFNSTFLPSTIREDKGVDGAIFVDSIIIREATLQYPNDTYKHQTISSNELQDSEFLEALNGLLVFDEHPLEFVDSANYNRLAQTSIGTIVNSEYKEINGDKLIVSTLRIANENAIKKIKNREIRGGSLGYSCDMLLRDGVEQINLKPNHFCITQYPRDDGVLILNSKKQGELMTTEEVKALINEALVMQNKHNDDLIVSKKVINSFLQTISGQIKDESIKNSLNGKSEIEKIHFLDNILSVNAKVFNSDEVEEYKGKVEAMEADIADDKARLAEYEAKIAELEKENSELKEAIANSCHTEEKTKNSDDKDNSDDKEGETKDDKEKDVAPIKKENSQRADIDASLSALDNLF